MRADQQGSTLPDQEKMKRKHTENLYRRDKRMTDTFEEVFYEEEPVILKLSKSRLENIKK